MELNQLKSKAREIRIEILKTIFYAQSGHPGGSLSSADMLTALYFNEMKVDPSNPKWEDRDRFILSKGHCSPLLYAVLAKKGFFPVEELKGFRQLGSFLQGHPDMNKVPGVDMSSGSLGQGLSIGNGMAIAAKLNKKDYRVYVLLGDGEMQEGQVWEAAMAAAHYKLSNVVAILDNNGLQSDGNVEKVKNIEPVSEKFQAFGWHTITIDGHDFDQILKALAEARNNSDKPTLIIMKTIKGKGVSFMENQAKWHAGALTQEQLDLGISELSASKEGDN